MDIFYLTYGPHHCYILRERTETLTTGSNACTYAFLWASGALLWRSGPTVPRQLGWISHSTPPVTAHSSRACCFRALPSPRPRVAYSLQLPDSQFKPLGAAESVVASFSKSCETLCDETGIPLEPWLPTGSVAISFRETRAGWVCQPFSNTANSV